MQKVVVSLFGGLGNQLFQYATALALAEREQADLILDLSWFEKQAKSATVTTRAYALKHFGIAHEIVNVKPLMMPSYRIAKRIPLTFKNSLGCPIYFEKQFSYDLQVRQLRLPIHLYGYWQSYRYFSSIQPLLNSTISQPLDFDQDNQSMLADIERHDAVCLHIRRGDYISNKHAAKLHGVCSIAYYAAAIQYFSQHLSTPKFYIFSDDIDWAKHHLPFDADHCFVDINGPEKGHLDFWLMKACQHFIVANSSLSWWAAWLSNRDVQKQVIAPQDWFVSNQLDTSDLIPENWLRR